LLILKRALTGYQVNVSSLCMNERLTVLTIDAVVLTLFVLNALALTGRRQKQRYGGISWMLRTRAGNRTRV
jgi:hypothetical protein